MTRVTVGSFRAKDYGEGMHTYNEEKRSALLGFTRGAESILGTSDLDIKSTRSDNKHPWLFVACVAGTLYNNTDGEASDVKLAAGGDTTELLHDRITERGAVTAMVDKDLEIIEILE